MFLWSHMLFCWTDLVEWKLILGLVGVVAEEYNFLSLSISLWVGAVSGNVRMANMYSIEKKATRVQSA